ncbi:hypothetical protein [Mycoplasma tauri]|uniref:hypothetical protein n=1 Tax=Mycoplasma tauri TaxID=547987 RepID=UPI001CBEA1D8|nr:hypothetical protein [Mycoplasma tauri]MBZ4226995.1 hypothetical protein [Mycoplasma tauri]
MTKDKNKQLFSEKAREYNKKLKEKFLLDASKRYKELGLKEDSILIFNNKE